MSFTCQLSPPFSSSLSREIIGHNEDIMTKISFYLPVKSILRFRSVSKQWDSLLTHHWFMQRYDTHNSTNLSLFFNLWYSIKSFHLKGSDDNNLEVVNFGYLKNSCQDKLSLISSCNGLLLFKSENFAVRDHAQKRYRFYVCNPSTRKYTELAVQDSLTTDLVYSSVYLVFDPSKSPHYKVLFFWNDERAFNCHTAIYLSETKTCRELSHTSRLDSLGLYSGALLNGAIYWIRGWMEMTPSLLPYFDINQETFRAFPKPPFSSRRNYVMYFGECRGHLHLIFNEDDTSPYLPRHIFDVYELKQDNSSWFAKYKVDLDAISVYLPEIIIKKKYIPEKHYACPRFLHVLGEDEKDPTVVHSFGKKIVAYNFIDKTTKMLCDISSPRWEEDDEDTAFSWHRTFLCNDSLSGV